jgi:hypothetical protein
METFTNEEIMNEETMTVPSTTEPSHPSQPQLQPPSSSQSAEMTVESPQIVLRDSTSRPVYKLSVKLIDTYKFINKVCFSNFWVLFSYDFVFSLLCACILFFFLASLVLSLLNFRLCYTYCLCCSSFSICFSSLRW